MGREGQVRANSSRVTSERSGEAIVAYACAARASGSHKSQEGQLPRRQEDHREGHHHLHAPAGGDDEGGRAAAAGLRHRRQGPRQPVGGQAAARHQDRRRDRLLARAGVPQVPAVFRRPLLQPGGRGRTGRHPRYPPRPPRDLQGKDPRHQGQDQERAVLPDLDHRGGPGRDRGDHDLRDPGLQGPVQELRRRPAGADPVRDGDLGLSS